MMKKIICALSLVFFTVENILAQCAMCKAGAETSLEAGSSQAAGINLGVLYILAITFAVLIFFAVLFYKAKKTFAH